jgi:cytoskeletal protein RodZ
LPAKHSARPLGPARIFLSAAAAVLVMLVVWVAVRAVGPAEAEVQPKVALPSMPQVPIAPSSSSVAPSPSVSPSLSRSPSSSPSSSPSATPSRTSARPKATSHSPVPEKTSASPTPAKTTVAPPAFSVTVGVPASWEQGYVASVRVQNTGPSAKSWSVTVSNAGLDNVRLLGTWSARGSQSGSNMTFTGGPLAPGATAAFGYQVSKTGRGNARPSGCSVVGGRCVVS